MDWRLAIPLYLQFWQCILQPLECIEYAAALIQHASLLLILKLLVKNWMQTDPVSRYEVVCLGGCTSSSDSCMFTVNFFPEVETTNQNWGTSQHIFSFQYQSNRHDVEYQISRNQLLTDKTSTSNDGLTTRCRVERWSACECATNMWPPRDTMRKWTRSPMKLFHAIARSSLAR